MTNEDFIKFELLGYISDDISTDEVLTYVENYGKMTKVIFQGTIKKAKEIKDVKKWRDQIAKAFELRVNTINSGKYSQKDASYYFFGLVLGEAWEVEEYKKYMESNREEFQKIIVEHDQNHQTTCS